MEFQFLPPAGRGAVQRMRPSYQREPRFSSPMYRVDGEPASMAFIKIHPLRLCIFRAMWFASHSRPNGAIAARSPRVADR
jgi:hypothetical protein